MGYLGKSPETIYSIYTSEFIATAGQTIFNANYGDAVEVYLNGSLLSKTAYSATNGVDVVLNTGATIGDRIVTNGYSSLVQSGVDSIPINGSTNAVSSNGVFDALVLKSETTHNHTGIYEPIDANIVRSTAGALPILSGANLTNLPAQVNITGNAATVTNGLYTTNIGTTVQAYNANTTTAGNMFNGISQLVQTDVSGKLPAIDGSLLTNLPSGATTLDGLTDVAITTPANTEVLTYNGTTWVNGVASVTDATKLPLAGGDMTGTIRYVYQAMVADDIAVSTADIFSKTISGATILTVSSVPTAPKVAVFNLELTNGGSAVITWFSGVKWTGGTAPTLTAVGLDILQFYTRDGGTTWRGAVISKDNK